MKTSRILVTIIDPHTFDSPWVVKENAWAEQYGRPIVALYDGEPTQVPLFPRNRVRSYTAKGRALPPPSILTQPEKDLPLVYQMIVTAGTS